MRTEAPLGPTRQLAPTPNARPAPREGATLETGSVNPLSEQTLVTPMSALMTLRLRLVRQQALQGMIAATLDNGHRTSMRIIDHLRA